MTPSLQIDKHCVSRLTPHLSDSPHSDRQTRAPTHISHAWPGLFTQFGVWAKGELCGFRKFSDRKGMRGNTFISILGQGSAGLAVVEARATVACDQREPAASAAQHVGTELLRPAAALGRRPSLPPLGARETYRPIRPHRPAIPIKLRGAASDSLRIAGRPSSGWRRPGGLLPLLVYFAGRCHAGRRRGLPLPP